MRQARPCVVVKGGLGRPMPRPHTFLLLLLSVYSSLPLSPCLLLLPFPFETVVPYSSSSSSPSSFPLLPSPFSSPILPPHTHTLLALRPPPPIYLLTSHARATPWLHRHPCTPLFASPSSPSRPSLLLTFSRSSSRAGATSLLARRVLVVCAPVVDGKEGGYRVSKAYYGQAISYPGPGVASRLPPTTTSHHTHHTHHPQKPHTPKRWCEGDEESDGGKDSACQSCHAST